MGWADNEEKTNKRNFSLSHGTVKWESGNLNKEVGRGHCKMTATAQLCVLLGSLQALQFQRRAVSCRKSLLTGKERALSVLPLAGLRMETVPLLGVSVGYV